MKKTFKIATLLCLVISILLIFAACDKTPHNTPAVTTPEQTTPEPTTPPHVHTEEVIPAVAPSCTETGLAEGKKCSACGKILVPQEEIAATGHSFGEWVETKAPTIKEEGEQTRSCSNCEETEISSISKLDDPDKPEGAVFVESVNGKNAADLLEQFVSDSAAAESYDFSATRENTEDGVTTTESVCFKIYNGNLYLSMQTAEMTADIWFVDGMCYTNMGGQKFRKPAESIEEIWGEDFISSFQKEALPKFSDEELENAANANIYLLDGVYIVTLHTTDDETGEDETERYYFNNTGELIRIEGLSETEHATFIFNSYNKPVEIAPPADADDYILPGNNNPNVPEGAVPVDTLNGMTCRDLLNKFLEEYPKCTTFDIEVLTQQYIDDEIINFVTAVKLGENALYFLMETDSEMMEMWVIGSTAYINVDGQKIKQENGDAEDAFDPSSFETIINSIIREMPDEYYSFVDNAQLYYYEECYFFIISMEVDGEFFSETVIFDENGKVVSIIDETNETYVMYTINGYGEPVEILPPEDADEYITADEIPDDTVTPELPKTEDEIYALYVDLCTTLQNAEAYNVFCDLGEDFWMNYCLSGEDKYVWIVQGDLDMEQWLIDGKGYSAIDGTTYEVDADEEFLSAFSMVEQLLPIHTIEKEEISNLRCTYNDTFGEIIVVFTVAGEDGAETQYQYALCDDPDYGYIEVTITEAQNGEVILEGSFYFNYIDDPEFEIILP